ncbi:tyrosine-protein phosphatase [Amycolatopsis sp. PS_44_ISF1]|uniref:tyrosine-protein phosphatase n=1 Tax=Amycolatopsis sp. PS_44_ISF1 TaxID=2974917 RepID=UPI0028E082CA|nr:tyrosine-protein phosphatase [Amycolatopsis sp. PS_44_ISF1]MDT8913502.1 tyrosine-protein phosphatase [Amycolatopsis sp. PS_44_ISF1]
MTGPANFRDLGGLAVLGGRIAPSRVYRGAGIHLLDRSATTALDTVHGVRGFVDLRSRREVELDGIAPVGAAQTRYAVPIEPSLDALRPVAPHDLLPASYLVMLVERAPALVLALRSIGAALERGAVVVHCVAGKDRTGVVVAVLLGLLGAADDTVIEDYTVSDQAHPAILEVYRRSPSAAAVTGQLPGHLHRAPPAAMEKLIRYVHRRYDGWAGWADWAGVPTGCVESLRTLVTPETTVSSSYSTPAQGADDAAHR